MLKGKPAGEPENVTMDAIRRILDEDAASPPVRRDRPSRHVSAQIVRGGQILTDADLTLQPVRPIEDTLRYAPLSPRPAEASDGGASRFEPLAAPEELDPSDAHDPAGAARPLLRRVIGVVTPARLACVGLFALAVSQPALTLILVLGWFPLVTGIFLLFGAPRVWRGLARLVVGLNRLSPRLAGRLALWLDGVALRWDDTLDLFPEGKVTSLYMPDFADAGPGAQDAVRSREVSRPSGRA